MNWRTMNWRAIPLGKTKLLGAALLAVGLMLVSAANFSSANEAADLVLWRGRIATLDVEKPYVSAIAIRGDRIVATGDDETIGRHIGEHTRSIDLAGKFACPGFIEGHGHFLSLGQSKQTVDLRSARSWDDVCLLMAKAAESTPPGNWIVGWGWHQSKWSSPPEGNVEGYPRHDQLSMAVPDHPVALEHASGHCLMANAAAMQLAQVTAATPDPAGGEILKDSAGQPTGLFRETAAGLIEQARTRDERRLPESQRRERWRRDAALAAEECLRRGVTSFHDAGASFDAIDLFRELAERGELGVRLWVMAGEDNNALARRLPEYAIRGVGDHHLTLGGIKRMIDGALGAHGAWLFEPYDDLPGNTGLELESLDSLRRTAELALEHCLQLCVHAIGDRANHETLNLFQDAFRRAGVDGAALRWRIEHAQHLAPADVPRFAQLGVIASMQASHCTSDAPFVISRLGQRRAAEGAYAWRKLLDARAIVINGSDAPVEPIDPLISFHAAITRQTATGATFFPKQCMTREEALASYTSLAAYAAFEEDLKGTLAPGKLADVVVLSHDLMIAPPETIRSATVEYTILGGKIRYARQ